MCSYKTENACLLELCYVLYLATYVTFCTVQEAHEAIRPTSASRSPDQLPPGCNADQRRLYDLIWKRTMACQMNNAEMQQVRTGREGMGRGGGAMKGKREAVVGGLRRETGAAGGGGGVREGKREGGDWAALGVGGIKGGERGGGGKGGGGL